MGTHRVEQGFNRNWMKANPELAVKAILKFFDDYPAPTWKVSVKADYMPGMTMMLVATKVQGGK